MNNNREAIFIISTYVMIGLGDVIASFNCCPHTGRNSRRYEITPLRDNKFINPSHLFS